MSVVDSTKLSKSMVTLIPAILISLTPISVNLRQGESQQFAATVSGTTNQAVNWSLNPAVGTLSTSGRYTAPATLPTAQTVTVTAQSAADPNRLAMGVVSLQTTPVVNQWSMGYWSPALPLAAIQWTGLTHIIHCAVLVKPDGTLDLSGISADAATLVAAAHAHNVKALVLLGQPGLLGHTTNLDQAITNQLSTLVASIMTVVNTYGYDGVDIDWEPFVAATSGAHMKSLAAALRTALGSKFLTAAIGGYNSISYWGANHSSFDRLNVMTYNMIEPSYEYLWFNSALYNQDPDYGSLALAITDYTTVGVPAAKLGLGLAFYGWKFTGGVLASDPSQGISGPRQARVKGQEPTQAEMSYKDIVPLITQDNYHWDPLAVVPYINHLCSTPQDYWYITYDDPQSIEAKVRYIVAQNLGGWIIWGLWDDYLPGDPHPHPLLDAVAAASR